jgi:hypothetical protein
MQAQVILFPSLSSECTVATLRRGASHVNSHIPARPEDPRFMKHVSNGPDCRQIGMGVIVVSKAAGECLRRRLDLHGLNALGKAI